VITGAARGIGREYALQFAAAGARVVVNDLGGARDGEGRSSTPAEDVVAEIEARGGVAVSDANDISTWNGAQGLIAAAIGQFGRVDVLVNNAGILRDRMLFNLSEQDWTAVIDVHLNGTFFCTRHVVTHWRERYKRDGAVSGRLINTSSSSGLFGRAGQANYGAAKAGIAALTIIAAEEMARWGVTANAIYPAAHSRLTSDLAGFADVEDPDDLRNPAFIAPLVVWLGSEEAADVTGRVFGTRGNTITLAHGWTRGPEVSSPVRWSPDLLGPVIRSLVVEGDAASGPSE